MALIAKQDVNITGFVPTYTAVSSSDTFDNDGRTMLYVKNGGASPDTVVLDSLVACNQGTDHNGGSIVTNATERVFGPFDPVRFNDANGRVTVTHSFITSVTCAVLRLPPIA